MNRRKLLLRMFRFPALGRMFRATLALRRMFYLSIGVFAPLEKNGILDPVLFGGTSNLRMARAFCKSCKEHGGILLRK